MSTLDSILLQYEKSKTNSGETRLTEEERMKRYFSTFLPKGVKSGDKRIRILPTKDGSSPFVEVFFHEMKIGDNWVKIYDPAQEGKRSPLNEVAEGLRLSGDPADKELAKTYRSKKYYIVKVIDRDNEADGPKFWRFKHNYKNDGIFDKIVPLFRQKGDITDINEGRDLILTLNTLKGNNGQDYTSVTAVIPEDKSPLHEDTSVSKEWIEGGLSWEDVYAKKPEEYLVLLAQGKTPRYDKNLERWVSAEDLSSETTMTFSGESNNSSTNANIPDTQGEADVDEDDDLPF